MLNIIKILHKNMNSKELNFLLQIVFAIPLQKFEYKSQTQNNLLFASTRASNRVSGNRGSCNSLKNDFSTPAIEFILVESVTSARGSSPIRIKKTHEITHNATYGW